jgi:hypothetical protein
MALFHGLPPIEVDLFQRKAPERLPAPLAILSVNPAAHGSNRGIAMVHHQAEAAPAAE